MSEVETRMKKARLKAATKPGLRRKGPKLIQKGRGGARDRDADPKILWLCLTTENQKELK